MYTYMRFFTDYFFKIFLFIVVFYIEKKIITCYNRYNYRINIKKLKIQ